MLRAHGWTKAAMEASSSQPQPSHWEACLSHCSSDCAVGRGLEAQRHSKAGQGDLRSAERHSSTPVGAGDSSKKSMAWCQAGVSSHAASAWWDKGSNGSFCFPTSAFPLGGVSLALQQ